MLASLASRGELYRLALASLACDGHYRLVLASLAYYGHYRLGILRRNRLARSGFFARILWALPSRILWALPLFQPILRDFCCRLYIEHKIQNSVAIMNNDEKRNEICHQDRTSLAMENEMRALCYVFAPMKNEITAGAYRSALLG